MESKSGTLRCKRLTPDVMGEINEMILHDAAKAEEKDKDDHDDADNGGGGNSGTLTIDATCAPSNIRYPQDVSLLNKARENAEKLLDVLRCKRQDEIGMLFFRRLQRGGEFTDDCRTLP